MLHVRYMPLDQSRTHLTLLDLHHHRVYLIASRGRCNNKLSEDPSKRACACAEFISYANILTQKRMSWPRHPPDIVRLRCDQLRRRRVYRTGSESKACSARDRLWNPIWAVRVVIAGPPHMPCRQQAMRLGALGPLHHPLNGA